MKAFVVKNLWDYEVINPPPERLPEMDRFYITDSEKNRDIALSLGWDYAFCINQFREETDLLKRRSIVGGINCYPEKVCKPLNDYNKIFVCDSNIRVMPSNYWEFIKKSKSQACYLTSGYYKGIDDDILMELYRSVYSRWNYNAEAMTKATNHYIKAMDIMGKRKTSVSSAKYVGWNLRNPRRKEIADYVVSEYKKHLQGNIIFTYVLARWDDCVLNFRTLRDDVRFTPHNYTA